ncbi:MAG: beta-Ala-His dipeptidase [Clostridia bacterium]|nr:beta-Ala-His dipeptidase [Clostridia bacterium]MBQ9781464.1 beta-Ala-His dipeptidase [Clostridia bacterium]
MHHQNRGILSAYEPHGVFSFFEDLCTIPHGSGNEAAVATYIENFAASRRLYCHRDSVHNVFIRLPASEGCENKPAVLLQGHTDMVCEKDSDSKHDFLTDGLDLFVEDGKIGARGTTLGGDNGIAVAMMLALLDNPPEKHPVIECLFTVSEETGLEGAHAFDPAAVGVVSKTMINLDSESESTVTVGCAGGMRTDITQPVTPKDAEGVLVRITLSGFSGGHSGVEIHEGHTNAIKAMGRLLNITTTCDWDLVSINGGGKDNAIPRDCEAEILVFDFDGNGVADAEKFCGEILAEAEKLRAEPNTILADKQFSCTAEIVNEKASTLILDLDGTWGTVTLLTLARDGVLAMNAHVKGMVAYSRNLGIIKTLCDEDGTPTAVKFSFSTRSACESHLDDAERELTRLAMICTGLSDNATHRARYPGWDYAPVSPIRDLWCQTAQELLGKTPQVEAIHAGLECGILCSKMPGMDIISVGPDMWDIHTPRERLSINSTARLYTTLLCVIEKLCR